MDSILNLCEPGGDIQNVAIFFSKKLQILFKFELEQQGISPKNIPNFLLKQMTHLWEKKKLLMWILLETNSNQVQFKNVGRFENWFH